MAIQNPSVFMKVELAVIKAAGRATGQLLENYFGLANPSPKLKTPLGITNNESK